MIAYRSLLFTTLLLFSVGVAAAAPTQQNAALYAVDPPPLTLDQCGQCHPKHFQDIKREGGQHQFDCRECHTVFHAYNPRKNNYADLMPDCANCHDLVHGEPHSRCLSCHANPHAITHAPEIAGVVNYCSDCHQNQKAQLIVLPSKHTELTCDTCHHTEHGLIPSCADCHQPHFSTQPMTTCANCHDVHQPLVVGMVKNVDIRTCASCHNEIFAKWQGTSSQHGQVSCIDCHDQHKKIPACQTCHATPPKHSEAMLKKFPRCLDCHLDVHDLPTKH